MTKTFLTFLLPCLLFQNYSAAQDGDAIAGIAGGLFALGAGIAAVEQMKEQAELNATEYFLTHYPNTNKFSLKTLDFDGKKLKDMSSASLITFFTQMVLGEFEGDIEKTRHHLLEYCKLDTYAMVQILAKLIKL